MMFQTPVWEYQLDEVRYKKLFKIENISTWKVFAPLCQIESMFWFALLITISSESAPVSCLKLWINFNLPNDWMCAAVKPVGAAVLGATVGVAGIWVAWWIDGSVHSLGSMDPSQAEASMLGMVRPSCGAGLLAYMRGLKKYQCIVENCPVRAVDGADFVSVFYLVL